MLYISCWQREYRGFINPMHSTAVMLVRRYMIR